MSSDIVQYMSDFDIYYDKDQLKYLNDSLPSKIAYYKNFIYNEVPQKIGN